MALTSAMEDYLEAVFMLQKQNGGCCKTVEGKKAFRKPGSQGTIQIRPSC